MVICCCNSISSGLLQAEVDCERMSQIEKLVDSSQEIDVWKVNSCVRLKSLVY